MGLFLGLGLGWAEVPGGAIFFDDMFQGECFGFVDLCQQGFACFFQIMGAQCFDQTLVAFFDLAGGVDEDKKPRQPIMDSSQGFGKFPVESSAGC